MTDQMTAQLLHKLEDMSRAIATWTSLAATAIFGSVFLATDNNLSPQVWQYLTGGERDTGLVVLLALLITVFTGLLIASKKQYSIVGGAISTAAAAGVYAWCEALDLYPYCYYLVALAAPGLFHLATGELQSAAARREVTIDSTEGSSETLEQVEQHYQSSATISTPQRTGSPLRAANSSLSSAPAITL